MIRLKLQSVREAREFKTGRTITWTEVAAGTGLNRVTISKMLNNPGINLELDNIDLLCTFFECKVEDLLEHVPGKKAPAAASRRGRSAEKPKKPKASGGATQE